MHRLHSPGLRGPLFFFLLLVGGTLSGLLSAQPVGAQERDVVFHQVTVSSAEASLLLEFADGEELAVAFRDGRVLVNGAEVAGYEPGAELDTSWRSLLREAVALENAELARLLVDWQPPSGLGSDAAAAAGSVQDRLQTALAPASAPTPPTPPRVEAVESDVEALMESLFLRSDRLRALPSALRNLDPERIRVYMSGDATIPAGEVLDATLLVLDSHLMLDGRVEGDVLLLGGTVTLGDDARVSGDLRWLDGEVSGNRAAVQGRIREIQPVPDRSEADLREEIRREVEAALAPVRQMQQRSRTGFRPMGAVRNVMEGIAQLFQMLVTFAILFALGLAFLYFVPRNFEVVARTARNAPGRSALVGLAGGVLAFPVWILGIVLLAVTIIGIPFMLLWLPAFPTAVALAIIVGYVAVARNVGRWASDRPIQGLDSLDGSRPAVQLGIGLVVLLAAFALAGVFQMAGPWLGLFKALLFVSGILVTVATAAMGLGAVILSRGGRDPLYAGPDWTYTGERDPWAPEGSPEPGPFHEPEFEDAPGEGPATPDDESSPERPEDRPGDRPEDPRDG